MKIALVLHPSRSVAADLAGAVAAAAASLDIEVSVDAADADRVPGAIPRDGDELTADVVVAVGGDGTVLEAARRAVAPGLPVVGVHAGNVGFLAEIQPEEIATALASLQSGKYTVTERMTLQAETSNGERLSALNDVVVEKDVSQHIIRVGVFADSEQLVEYRADGVIVATPTGSTAYTFSAGGPLIDPDLEALTVTAVAPHTLFGRPIVFAPTTVLRLQLAGERPARLNADGRDHGLLQPGESVSVTVGPEVIRLIRLQPQHFAAAVKRKFHLHDA
ncbi:MAG: NAD(+)/NADH kinase [Acidimicrobiia bacterium]